MSDHRYKRPRTEREEEEDVDWAIAASLAGPAALQESEEQDEDVDFAIASICTVVRYFRLSLELSYSLLLAMFVNTFIVVLSNPVTLSKSSIVAKIS